MKTRTTRAAPTKPAMVSAKSSKKTKPNSAVKRKAADDSSPVTKKKFKTDKAEPGKKNISDKANTPGKRSRRPGPIKVPEEGKGELQGEEDVSEFDSESDQEAGSQASEAIVRLIDSDAEDDESDEDEGAIDKELQGIAEVPKIPKHRKAAKKGEGEEPGTIYVGRIPHGFYEHQMKEYFSQFGPVNKLRLSRNKKTGASKHYAFIEFAEESTAEIVAKTMNNYLLFNHILKVQVVPKDKIHPELWKGCNRRFKVPPRDKLMARELQKPKPQSVWSGRVSREDKRRVKKAKQLQEMDYEFEMPALAPIPKPFTAEGEEGVMVAIEAAPESKEVTEQGETAEKALEEAIVKETKVSEEPAPAKTQKANGRRNVKKRQA